MYTKETLNSRNDGTIIGAVRHKNFKKGLLTFQKKLKIMYWIICCSGMQHLQLSRELRPFGGDITQMEILQP